MTKRYAVLYSDGSFNVSSEKHDLLQAEKFLAFTKADEDSKFVEVEIKVVKVIKGDNKLRVIKPNSVLCSCCGTVNEVPEEVDMEQLKERYEPCQTKQ